MSSFRTLFSEYYLNKELNCTFCSSIHRNRIAFAQTHYSSKYLNNIFKKWRNFTFIKHMDLVSATFSASSNYHQDYSDIAADNVDYSLVGSAGLQRDPSSFLIWTRTRPRTANSLLLSRENCLFSGNAFKPEVDKASIISGIVGFSTAFCFGKRRPSASVFLLFMYAG